MTEAKIKVQVYPNKPATREYHVREVLVDKIAVLNRGDEGKRPGKSTSRPAGGVLLATVLIYGTGLLVIWFKSRAPRPQQPIAMYSLRQIPFAVLGWEKAYGWSGRTATIQRVSDGKRMDYYGDTDRVKLKRFCLSDACSVVIVYNQVNGLPLATQQWRLP